MIATWRAIWLLIGVGAVFALGPVFFVQSLNGLTVLGVVMLLAAWFFVLKRGWE